MRQADCTRCRPPAELTGTIAGCEVRFTTLAKIWNGQTRMKRDNGRSHETSSKDSPIGSRVARDRTHHHKWSCLGGSGGGHPVGMVRGDAAEGRFVGRACLPVHLPRLPDERRRAVRVQPRGDVARSESGSGDRSLGAGGRYSVRYARASPISNLRRCRRHIRHRHRRNAGRWISSSIGEFDRDLGRKRLRKVALHPDQHAPFRSSKNYEANPDPNRQEDHVAQSENRRPDPEPIQEQMANRMKPTEQCVSPK